MRRLAGWVQGAEGIGRHAPGEYGAATFVSGAAPIPGSFDLGLYSPGECRPNELRSDPRSGPGRDPRRRGATHELQP